MEIYVATICTLLAANPSIGTQYYEEHSSPQSMAVRSYLFRDRSKEPTNTDNMRTVSDYSSHSANSMKHFFRKRRSLTQKEHKDLIFRINDPRKLGDSQETALSLRHGRLFGKQLVIESRTSEEKPVTQVTTVPTTPLTQSTAVPKSTSPPQVNLTVNFNQSLAAPMIGCSLKLFRKIIPFRFLDVLNGFVSPRILCAIEHLEELVPRAGINILNGFFRPRIGAPLILQQEANPAAEINILNGFINMNLMKPILYNMQLNPQVAIDILNGITDSNILSPQLLSQTLTPTAFIHILDGIVNANILSPQLISQSLNPQAQINAVNGFINPRVLSPRLITQELNPAFAINVKNFANFLNQNSPTLIANNLSPLTNIVQRDEPLEIFSPSLVNADSEDVISQTQNLSVSENGKAEYVLPDSLISINRRTKSLFHLSELLKSYPELYGFLKLVVETQMEDLLKQAIAIRDTNVMKSALANAREISRRRNEQASSGAGQLQMRPQVQNNFRLSNNAEWIDWIVS